MTNIFVESLLLIRLTIAICLMKRRRELAFEKNEVDLFYGRREARWVQTQAKKKNTVSLMSLGWVSCVTCT
jgi:hypothetical protein